jgi:hypothetical protein
MDNDLRSERVAVDVDGDALSHAAGHHHVGQHSGRDLLQGPDHEQVAHERHQLPRLHQFAAVILERGHAAQRPQRRCLLRGAARAAQHLHQRPRHALPCPRLPLRRQRFKDRPTQRTWTPSKGRRGEITAQVPT